MQVYSGYSQSQFLLNCTFIGPKDYFVAVGSEGIINDKPFIIDGNVYLFHKFNPKHSLIIQAHDMTVNAIACRQNIMVTVSDDQTLKLWGTKGSQ